jgi:serine/threonine protein kinase
VKEGVEIATSKPCALKIMKKSVVQDNNLVKEVEIMRQLKHPNIISLQDIYETDSELILVLELYVIILLHMLFHAFAPFRNDKSHTRSSVFLLHYFHHTFTYFHCIISHYTP